MEKSTFQRVQVLLCLLICSLWCSPSWAYNPASKDNYTKQSSSSVVFDVPAEPVRIGIEQPFNFAIGFKSIGESGIYAEGISGAPFGYSDPDNMHLYAESAESWATAEHVGSYTMTVWAIDNDGTHHTDTFTLIVEADCKNLEWYRDADGDGFGRGNARQLTCSAWEGLANNNTDCNDADATINPEAAEVPGDGKDNNCNGQVDEATDTFALKQIPAIVVGTSQALEVFIPAEGSVIAEAGFQGSKPAWLNAEKTADGKAVRVWGTPPSNSWGTYTPTVYARSSSGAEATQKLSIRVGNCKNQLWYADADADGYGAIGSELSACWQPTGYVRQGGDCNDADASINPANGDTNCGEEEDQAPVITIRNFDPKKYYYAAGQEYVFIAEAYDPNKREEVTLKAEYHKSFYKEGELSFSPATSVSGTDTVRMEIRWTPNTDRPEILSIDLTATEADGDSTNTYMNGDPYIPTKIVVPAEPIVIGVDQSFTFNIDFDSDPNESEYYAYFDNIPSWAIDNFTEHSTLTLRNSEQLPGMADVGTYQFPVTVWYPWGATRDTVTVIVAADCTNKAWYPDKDQDGYGSGRDYDWTTQRTCSSWENYKSGWIGGYVENNTDCNDWNAAINPGAEEIPGDGKDNNCNGQVDESTEPFALQQVPAIVVGAASAFEIFIPIEKAAPYVISEAGFQGSKPTWLSAAKTADGNAMRVWGTPPSNGWGTYTPTVYAKSSSGAEATQKLSIRVGNCKLRTWYADADGDGYGASEASLTACWQPAGYVARGGDCNDWDATINPGAGNCGGATATRIATAESEATAILPELSFYPNPVEDILTINTGLQEATRMEVQMYNLQGALVYKGQHVVEAATGTLQLDLRELKQGVYLLRLQGQNMKQTMKIVKE